MVASLVALRGLAAVLAGAALVSIVALAGAACPPERVELGTPAHYLVGPSPTGVVTADFNGDDILDLAVASSHLAAGTTAGEVVVLLGVGSGGIGSGTFGAGTWFPAGNNPLDIVTGDFTGDGILDLVVSNYSMTTLSLLRGLGAGGVGDGTFAAPTPIGAGNKPHHIARGDFNHDGILDLAAANNAAACITVMLGQGAGGVADGTFAPLVVYPTSGFNTGIDAADLDSDGIVDIAAASHDGHSIDLFYGNGAAGIGDGTFQAAVHLADSGIPYDATLADATGDGILDVVVSREGTGGGIELYRGTGGRAFAAPTQPLAASNVGESCVLDFDGDGLPDIVCSRPLYQEVAVLHGVGGGTFQSASARPVLAFPVFMTTGDFNEDGAPDVVVTNYMATAASVLLNSCSAVPTVFRIEHVRDVPRDQGGRVWVTWPAHALDVSGGSITGYRVWRRIPAADAAAAGAKGALRSTIDATGVVYWEAAATLPAQALAAYGYTAATPQDSLAGGNPYTAFFITATTASPGVFYDTPIDSGYSVDNLSPAAPSQVEAEFGGGAATLHWAANAEADLYGYRVHRGAGEFFVPSPANLIGTPVSPVFVDHTNDVWFYKVGAMDVHGNVGAFTLVEPNAPVGVDVALVSFEATANGVLFEWYADAHAVPLATLQRDEGGGAWLDLAQASPDAGGRLVFRDSDVVPGRTYAYCLSWTTEIGERTTPATIVTIPALALTLAGARPNPVASARLAIRFELPGAAPAMLELFDVGGRRVLRRDVGAMGAGPHVLDLARARLRGGVYLARLSQGGAVRSARIVVL